MSYGVELFKSPENHLDIFHPVSSLLLHMHTQNPVLDECVTLGLCWSFEYCFGFWLWFCLCHNGLRDACWLVFKAQTQVAFWFQDECFTLPIFALVLKAEKFVDLNKLFYKDCFFIDNVIELLFAYRWKHTMFHFMLCSFCIILCTEVKQCVCFC